MSTGQLQKKIEQVRRKTLVYKSQWPRRAGIIALKYIDGNFRAQGYRDKTLIPWRKTKSGKKVKFGVKSSILLGKTRRLMRGTRMQPRRDSVLIYNRVKYAGVHNNGYRGIQSVKAHTRRRVLRGSIAGQGGTRYNYGTVYSVRTHRKMKDRKVTDVVNVRAHKRKMFIPQRQFMPNKKRGSHILMKEERESMQKDMQKMLKQIR